MKKQRFQSIIEKILMQNVLFDLILVSAQVSEMQQCKQAIYDLERLHSQIKKQYEDEIMRLRSELESRGIPVPIPTEIRPHYRKLSIAPDTAPPPNLGSGNRGHSMGSFGNLMQAGHHPFGTYI
jgi:hypothetical protein